MWMVSPLLCVVAWVARVAETGDSPTTVNGTWGQSVSLPPGIPIGPDVAELVWRRLSPRVKIVTYSKKISDYYGSEEYKRRITFHPGNFSLEIRDLQREDTGDYEVTVTASSGAQAQNKMRLEVYEWMGTVTRAWGQLVSLPAGITRGLDVSQVVWRRDGTTIAEYANGVISYFGPEEYKRRITLHLGNFSLEIRDLQIKDTGYYEVTVTASSGTQTQNKMRLEVYEWMGTVKGARGETVSLTAGITVGPGVSEVVWRSDGTKKAKYRSGNISYFGPEEYKRRITLHPRKFSLEIRNLQIEDAGDYEVEIAVGSGAESKARVRLEVYDPDLRTSYNGWMIATVILIVILVIVILYLVYDKCHIKLRDSCSRGNKSKGKKSGTPDDQVETQPLENQKKEPATDAPE
ncbi:muscle M-line assembly protein unc-89-like [Mobula birostris]|uniref:muscle M-line assembly protein unc-89-like n=1 Tax=Mobula birostris TaxID=1983395 RepID=UPI003B28254B